MPSITIYNDTETDFDAAFDVVEVVRGQEIARKTLPPDKECNQFELVGRDQAFVIVPKGAVWPLDIVSETVSGYRRKP